MTGYSRRNKTQLMNTDELAYQRLHNQLVSHQPFDQPDEVVRWMTAVQAQDYRGSLWAIGLRLASASARETTVRKAIADRKIVRTWPMRGTLHWVAAADVRWMLRLLTPRVIKGSAGRYRQLELDAAVFDKSSKIIEKALAGGKAIERQELYGLLEKGGIRTNDQRGVHILGHLAMSGLICQGLPLDNQPVFVLLEDWLPSFEIPDQEKCFANLASRYFKSHGPATVYDFSVWAGIKVSDARKALEMVQADFEQATIEGSTYWFAELKETVDFKAGGESIYLLPAFDEILCGYKDRSPILDSADVKSAILKNGIIRPVLVAGNKAVGAWKRTIKKEKAIVEAFPFETLNHGYKKMLTEKARELGKFLDKEVSLIF